MPNALMPRTPMRAGLLSHICYDPDPDATGDPKPEDKPPKKKKAAEDDGKITLTKEELAQQISDAIKKREEELAAEAKKKEDDAEAERKKKAGEFEKLYQSEVEARKKEEAERLKAVFAVRSKDVDIKLRDYLAEHHKEYPASVAKYIKPLVEFQSETPEAEIEKSIKSAVESYVKDNPRTPNAGAPAHHNRNTTPEPQNPGKKEKLPLPSYARNF